MFRSQGVGVDVGRGVDVKSCCGARGVCSNDKVGTSVGSINSVVGVAVGSSAIGVSRSGVLLTAVNGVLANGLVAKGVFVKGAFVTVCSQMRRLQILAAGQWRVVRGAVHCQMIHLHPTCVVPGR